MRGEFPKACVHLYSQVYCSRTSSSGGLPVEADRHPALAFASEKRPSVLLNACGDSERHLFLFTRSKAFLLPCVGEGSC